MRLQKYLSACGACSRRKAEELILAGRVRVNGVTAVLGQSVNEEEDAVELDGRLLALPEKHTYIMLYKPRGCVTTLSDPQGRQTVAELVSDAGVRLYPVGRLDVQSEGLLLMTDDGETANKLAHPSHGVEKTYRVWVRGENCAEKLSRLREPVKYEKETYHALSVELLHAGKTRARADITVAEGKNHEVRNMCAAVGLQVERLLRWRQGELTLRNMAAGEWRYLTRAEINSLERLE